MRASITSFLLRSFVSLSIALAHFLPASYGFAEIAFERHAVGFTPRVILVGITRMDGHDPATHVSTAFLRTDNVSVDRLFSVSRKTVVHDGPDIAVGITDVYRIQLAADADVSSTIAHLQKTGALFAEPDYVARAIPITVAEHSHILMADREKELTVIPNDPLYAEQWGLARINAPAAWDVVTGNAGALIAVIDSGVDLEHPDIASRLWVNPGEVAGNGVDDDNNGYIDDVHGWNFVDDTADVADDSGHGTQVAGIAAAAGNNAIGITGTCWNCRIMVIKVMHASNVANYSDIAEAVHYAAAKGARVINISLGGYADSNALRLAIDSASDSAVIVAGAGNDASSAPFYPAAYTNVIGVAATTREDVRMETSNYGNWVDLVAPGDEITTTFAGGLWGLGSGTSLAAPFVAGLAALIRSQHSTWRAALARAQLLQTARASGFTDSGIGLPDAAAAIQPGRPRFKLTNVAVDGDIDGRLTPGESMQFTLELANQWLDATGVVVTASVVDPAVVLASPEMLFGDIALGEAKTGSAVTLSISPDAGYGQVISMNLLVRANDGMYTDSLPVTLTTRSVELPVCGNIGKDTTWTRDRIYVVSCDLRVLAGYTLTIEPGTVVQFRGTYALTTSGTLIADGTQDRPILFEPEQDTGLWKGLHYDDSARDSVISNLGVYEGGSILRHVRVRGAVEGVSCAAVTLYIAHVTIDGGGLHCTTGLGNTSTRSQPILGVTALNVVAGARHSCALSISGGVKCWGRNDHGQIGDSSTLDARSPQDVQGLVSGVESIVAGQSHTCVLMSSGGVKCWGSNEYGQLGVGDSSDAHTPQDVPGLSSDVVALAAGALHTCASTASRMYCWGYNGSGQLGSGDLIDSDVPQLVPGLGGAESIVAGAGHTCVMLGDGIKCWGANDWGQLGDGSMLNASTPQNVSGLTSGVAAITAGDAHTCALMSDGAIQCWGSNLEGQLGTDNTANAALPQNVIGLASGVVAISGGGLHSCALLSSGELRCWGWGLLGQLGHGDTLNSWVPQDVNGLDSGVSHVSTGGSHTCVQMSSGGVKCWGGNWYGQLGDGSTMNKSLATVVEPFIDPAWISWLMDNVIKGPVMITGPVVITGSTIDEGLRLQGMALLQENQTGPVVVGTHATIVSNVIEGGLLAGDHASLLGNSILGGVVVGAYANVERNSIHGASGAGLDAGRLLTAMKNRVVSNGSGIILSGTGYIVGNLIADNAGDGLQIGAVSVISNTFTGNHGSAVVLKDAAPLAFVANNLEGNPGPYDLYIDLPQGLVVDVQGNWWGTKNTDLIGARIYDGRMDATKSSAVYTISATAPNADSPAYVRKVSVGPDTTIGIQTAMFDVEFSRDVSLIPAPVLVAAGPLTVVTASLQEISGTHAVFSADITSLWPRGVYSILIKSAVGEDGVEIAPNSAYTISVEYANAISDQTPPSTPQVSALSDGSLTQLVLRWRSLDLETAITHYRYAVGTMPGAADVVHWTTINATPSQPGNAFTIIRDGLHLVRGQAYYVSVQARNAGGLWSIAGISNPVGAKTTYAPLL